MIKLLFILRSSLPEQINGSRFFPLIAISLFYCWTPVFCGAQQTGVIRELIPNAASKGELQGGERHVYKITLSAGSYLRVLLSSNDLYLESELFAPDSSTDIGVIFYPNEREQRFISLIAETSGSYTLGIRPTLKDAKAGHYEVKIEELRTATETDRAHLAAERAEMEGVRLLTFASTVEQKRQGIAKYEEALGRWSKLGERKGELRMLAYIDIQYRELGEPQTALEYRKQAIEIARTVGDRYQEANLIMGFGQLHRSLGESQKALDSFNQARQLFKELSARYGEATAIQNIGITLLNLGEWQNGVQHLEEALVTYSAVGSRSGECVILNSIGSVHRRLGNIEKAIAFHNRVLAIARANKLLDAESASLGNLGTDYFESGDRQKALDFFEQALKLSRASGVRVYEGDMLKRIGDSAYLLGDHQKALDFFNQALALYRSIWERRREARALHSLAQVNTALGNFEEARQQIEKSLEIQESLRANIISQELRETIFTSAQSSFALYIDLLMRLHKKNPTAGHEAAALQASERARARGLLDLFSESQADIRQGVPENLLERERSLQQQINAKAAARTRLLSNKPTPVQAAFFDKEIAELSARYREVQVQIRQSSPRYAALTQPQPLSANEIQQQLDDRTVLLEFALGSEQSWLWAVTRSSINSYQLPSNSQIEPSARKVYELLTARQPKKGETENQYQTRIAEAELGFQAESAALSQTLFGQVAAKLQQEWKGKRLAIIASGALEYIPFSALPVPEAKEQQSVAKKENSRSSSSQLPPPLIAQHEIVNLPSASALAAMRSDTAGRKRADKNVAILADPVFEATDARVMNSVRKSATNHPAGNFRTGNEGQTSLSENAPQASSAFNPALMQSVKSFTRIDQRGGFSRLPFSREEAEAIASLVPKTSSLKATDFQATRTIATNRELSRYRIVHFATHGLLNSEHPELSGLVLSLVDETGKAQDGFLRMNEIYNLELPADLVVLSACQTALGKQIKGEGLVGLTRGFMYAGAQRVVASLWQVDDLATAELMKSFYRGMLKEGLRPAAALRGAQLEMQGQKRWSSPFFWAAFTLQGEWK